MTITTQLSRMADGTKVSITAENIPLGISEGDHRKSMETSLKNVALLLE